jgi:hypothetical protein
MITFMLFLLLLYTELHLYPYTIYGSHATYRFLKVTRFFYNLKVFKNQTHIPYLFHGIDGHSVKYSVKFQSNFPCYGLLFTRYLLK